MTPITRAHPKKLTTHLSVLSIMLFGIHSPAWANPETSLYGNSQQGFETGNSDDSSLSTSIDNAKSTVYGAFDNMSNTISQAIENAKNVGSDEEQDANDNDNVQPVASAENDADNNSGNGGPVHSTIENMSNIVPEAADSGPDTDNSGSDVADDNSPESNTPQLASDSAAPSGSAYNDSNSPESAPPTLRRNGLSNYNNQYGDNDDRYRHEIPRYVDQRQLLPMVTYNGQNDRDNYNRVRSYSGNESWYDQNRQPPIRRSITNNGEARQIYAYLQQPHEQAYAGDNPNFGGPSPSTHFRADPLYIKADPRRFRADPEYVRAEPGRFRADPPGEEHAHSGEGHGHYSNGHEHLRRPDNHNTYAQAHPRPVPIRHTDN